MKNRTSYNLLVFTAVLFLGQQLLMGCTAGQLNAEELQEYVLNSDNGLISSKEVNGVSIKMLYRPSELLVHRELNPERGKTLEALRDKYGKFDYFILSYSRNGQDILKSGVGGQADYAQKLQELSFNMQNHLKLVGDGKDTIPMTDYIYQNMFGASHSTELLFVYAKEKIDNYSRINFRLNDIGFSTGMQEFAFEVSDLRNTPRLDFKDITQE